MTTAIETNASVLTPVAGALRTLHADSTVLYFKLRSYHWNVTGKHFFQLHSLFQKFYEEWAETGDALAERLLAIDLSPILTVAEQLRASVLREDIAPDSAKMIPNILADLEKMTASFRDLARTAQNTNDVATMNLADGLADKNEQTMWMLRAYLKQN
jgi:starvation-inducible DNA-binding protein